MALSCHLIFTTTPKTSDHMELFSNKKRRATIELISTSTATTTDASSELTSPTQLPLLVPSLPDDVTLHCVARIPRSHHFTLSSISKSFKSLLSSPLFFSTRSLLRVTEPLIFVSMKFLKAPFLLYFTLIQNPISLRYFLLSIPPPPTPGIGSAFVPLGHKIYVIGGSIDGNHSAKVSVLDCRFNTWETIPSMHIGRKFPAAGVVDGKIYVIGGCIDNNILFRSKHWAEVFDPKTQVWETVDSSNSIDTSLIIFRDTTSQETAVINDMIYASADGKRVVYDPKNGKWEQIDTELDRGWSEQVGSCVIDNVMYCFCQYSRKITYFDVKIRKWRELKVLDEKEYPTIRSRPAMANLGGKLAVLWQWGKQEMVMRMSLFCAVIALKKGDQGELWGNMERCDVVRIFPRECWIVHCAAVTL